MVTFLHLLLSCNLWNCISMTLIIKQNHKGLLNDYKNHTLLNNSFASYLKLFVHTVLRCWGMFEASQCLSKIIELPPTIVDQSKKRRIALP